MPKMHPIYGVPVLTQEEFWNQEAEREGKGRCGADLMHEMYDEMDREIASQEDELKNPEILLEEIKRSLDGWNNGIDPKDEEYFHPPSEILEVRYVSISSSFRGSGVEVHGTAIRSNDKKKLKFIYIEGSSSGSFYEPPDTEVNLIWEDEDDFQRIRKR